MIILLCITALLLHQCAAFVHPSAVQSLPPRKSQLVDAHHVVSSRPVPSALRMAKKRGGASSKRKKKKEAFPGRDAGAGASTTGGTSLTDADTDVLSPSGAVEELEDAGASMVGGGFGSQSGAQGELLLADDTVGSDAAREAKIEETLRKLGVQGAREEKAVGPETSSIFNLVPEEAQILIERVLIAGFVLCLLVLVGCGLAIAAEAYFLATKGKLPPDLDNFVVQTIEPLFSPSLVATFGFSSAWGVLKLGQMGQEGVAYKEDD